VGVVQDRHVHLYAARTIADASVGAFPGYLCWPGMQPGHSCPNVRPPTANWPDRPWMLLNAVAPIVFLWIIPTSCGRLAAALRVLSADIGVVF